MRRVGLACAYAWITIALMAAPIGAAAQAPTQPPAPPSQQPAAPPPQTAPAPQANVTPPPSAPAPEARRDPCNTIEKPLSAGGASIVQEEAGQLKNWQPPGGEISFTVRSFEEIPAASYVFVCFRWARKGVQQDPFVPARPVHLDLSENGRLLRVTVVVPYDLHNPPSRLSGDGEYAAYYLVPLADVRILAIRKQPDAKGEVAADVSHRIGVTSALWASLLALATAIAAFGILTLVCHRRLKRAGLANLNPLICVITTPDGYASLSQLQMVLWTFVVATSAVYVMALSGELIEVTTGTLVLLGISGTVTVAVKLRDGTPSATPRQPLWSDLFVNEVNGVREIDITRVQMLYFTLITAAFVVMRVVTTYVIPEIPQGFQVLMGISNAVYFGSKVATNAAPTAAPAPDPAPAPAPDPASSASAQSG